jgi:hypothetical protein
MEDGTGFALLGQYASWKACNINRLSNKKAAGVSGPDNENTDGVRGEN